MNQLFKKAQKVAMETGQEVFVALYDRKTTDLQVFKSSEEFNVTKITEIMLNQSQQSKIDEQKLKEITGISKMSELPWGTSQGLNKTTTTPKVLSGTGPRVNRKFIREITAIKSVKKKPMMADIVKEMN